MRTDIKWAGRIESSSGGGIPGLALGAPDCLSAGVHNLMNNPIELTEQEFPLQDTLSELNEQAASGTRSRVPVSRPAVRARRDVGTDMPARVGVDRPVDGDDDGVRRGGAARTASAARRTGRGRSRR